MAKVFGQYSLLILTALGLTISQLLLKQGTKSSGALSLTSPAQLMSLIRHVLVSPLLLLGYALSGITALMWLVLLSRFELSYAGPVLTAFYYILLLLSSAIVLHEAVTPSRWLGVLLVVAGVVLIARVN
jgi:drug/metabolite transporter (DMT)-like permease